MSNAPAPSLDRTEAFDVSPARGFLPPQDPLRRLPSAYEAWEQLAADLPKLLVSDKLRRMVDRLPGVDTAELAPGPQLERAMMLLSYLGHAYVWGGGATVQPAKRLRASLAVPWYEVAKKLGRPPVLSYASYALHNWRRLDPAGPVALGNICLIQNFGGGVDEEWFILVHVDIEAKAAPALASIGPAQRAVLAGDAAELARHLAAVARALDGMNKTMNRMPEYCDPYVYYHRVRPYIFGWRNQPALPDGLVYDGVVAYGGKPQQFRGETGAQSSIVPTLDALLGVQHADDPLRAYLTEMRQYMPPKHRAFVEAVERGPSVREFVMARGGSGPTLRDAYNRCVQLVELFRAKHFEYAARYIHQQSRSATGNPTDVGTGGTPFMPYLKKHLDETAVRKLPDDPAGRAA
jgi:indoleamine 2,3-dioxygenase